MKKAYVTLADFKKSKTIHTFPNPMVKDALYKGEKVRLCVAGNVKVESLDDEGSKWYGYTGTEKLVMITCSEGFPTDLFCDVVGHKYVPKKEFGLIFGNNTGSCSELFPAKKLNSVLSVLKKNHFTVA